jgi:hypothetical protein
MDWYRDWRRNLRNGVVNDDINRPINAQLSPVFEGKNKIGEMDYSEIFEKLRLLEADDA